VSLVLRCPKCQGRFEPAGSIDAGNLDTRCPHCALARQKKKQKRAGRSTFDLPPDVVAGSYSPVVWVSAAIGGAMLLLIITVAIIAAVAARFNKNDDATAKPASNRPAAVSKPNTTPRDKEPTVAPEVPPADGVAPAPRVNDNNWDR
jgi:hypothetical protein